MARVAIPVTAHHEDESVCTHWMTPDGKPDEEGCTGRAFYLAVCGATGCDWTKDAGIRSIVDEARSYHRGTHTAER